MTGINRLDEMPPDEPILPDCSVDVLLVYADGTIKRGYRNGWDGWCRYDGWLPCPVDDDDEQPIGWREMPENVVSLRLRARRV